jgi:hypothetical protein
VLPIAWRGLRRPPGRPRLRAPGQHYVRHLGRPGSVPSPFNKDAARRDRILGAGLDVVPAGYRGGIARFDELDAAGLALLLDEKFIDPHDRQNAAPSVWEIFRFLCAHPNVRAAGYVVDVKRADYRTSIEAIYASEIDAGLRTDARTFCVHAETTF